MSSQVFALDAVGTQVVRVSEVEPGKSYSIYAANLLDDSADSQSLKKGWTRQLADGATLRVRLVGQEASVYKDGHLLRKMSSEPFALPRVGLGVLFTTSLVVVVMVGPLAAFLLYAGPYQNALWENAHTSDLSIPTWPFLAAAVFCILIALGALALLFRRKWGFFLMAGSLVVSAIILPFTPDSGPGFQTRKFYLISDPVEHYLLLGEEPQARAALNAPITREIARI